MGRQVKAVTQPPGYELMLANTLSGVNN